MVTLQKDHGKKRAPVRIRLPSGGIVRPIIPDPSFPSIGLILTSDGQEVNELLALGWYITAGDQGSDGISIFRGVFTLGKTYRKGDVVLVSGKAYKANAETQEQPPDQTWDWISVEPGPASVLYHGEGGPPATFGLPGEYWLDLTAKKLYGPKIPEGWGAGLSFTPQDLSTGATPTFVGLKLTEELILPKTFGKGIKVDISTPTYPWVDLLGTIHHHNLATDPDWTSFRGAICGWKFPVNVGEREVFIELHVPHDWAGTDLYLHLHWAQAIVDSGGPAGVPGSVEWSFDLSYAKGHGTPGGAADPFNAPITTKIVQQGSTTQYGHLIAEKEITNAGGDSSHFDLARIEVDGLLLVRAYRNAGSTLDTLNQSPYVFFVDLHYQSTGIGTKQKAPNFYS